MLPNTAYMSLVFCLFFFFSFQSLCHSTARGCGWSTDSIGLSGALNIVFIESAGVKRPLRSTESSHTHLVHSLKPCFLCVQSSHATSDFLDPPLQWLINTNMYVIQTLDCGSRWNNTSRKCTQSKHFLGLLHSNFPSCAIEKSAVQASCYHVGLFFLENFAKDAFKVLTPSLVEPLFIPIHSREAVNGR